MKTRVAIFAGALGLWAGLASAQAPDPKLVSTGRQLFGAKMCTTCHQAEGKGNKAAPLDGITAKLKREDIEAWITDPVAMTAKLPTKPRLPMRKLPLTPPEVAALVAYLESLPPPKP